MAIGPWLTAEEIDQIRELRARNLSQAAVAAIVGRSTSTIWKHSPGWRAKLPCIPPEQVAEIRRLRADGHTAAKVAEMVGVSRSTVQSYAPGRIGKVPVAPLREAFLASPVTAGDVARELGWTCRVHSADSARVKRTLGLLPDISRHEGRRSYRTLVDAETVMRIAEAIGISPWAVLPDE